MVMRCGESNIFNFQACLGAMAVSLIAGPILFVRKRMLIWVLVLGICVTMEVNGQTAAAARNGSSETTVSSSSATTCRYASIFSFGDSLSDTGNAIRLSQNGITRNADLPPYGESYFHHPTGRCSDGRLVIDFIAEHLRLPFVPPYYGGRLESFRKIGVNFALVGATALDIDFLRARGIVVQGMTNVSLSVQLGLFKKLLPSLCSTRSECQKLLSNSFIILGEIGGDDFNDAFFTGVSSTKVIRGILPYVINTIGLAIKELIELGAVTILVPGNIPIGCLPSFLTLFPNVDKREYDNSTGCLNRFNKFAEYYNGQLVAELNRIQELHPYAKIIYADYYNAAMRFYRSPNQYGFTGGALKACCGGRGPYNFNLSAGCGSPLATVCDDPSSYASWDGIHFTEAAYKFIFKSVIEGPYPFPRYASCIVDGKYP